MSRCMDREARRRCRLRQPSITLCKIGILIGECWGALSPGSHRAECIDHEQRLGAFSCELFNPLLKLSNDMRMLGSAIGLLGWVGGNVVQFERRRQRRAPDKLPVSET